MGNPSRLPAGGAWLGPVLLAAALLIAITSCPALSRLHARGHSAGEAGEAGEAAPTAGGAVEARAG